MTITTVSSLEDLQTEVAAAATDDLILVANGEYDNDAPFSLSTSATRVTVQAEHHHAAIIMGSPISLASPGIKFMGFDLMFSLPSGNYGAILGGANGCHFSHNMVHFTDGAGAGSQHWIRVLASDCHIHHNEFMDKSELGNMLLIGEGSTITSGNKIYANYFHDQSATGSNGGETLRLGSSETAWIDFNAEVFNNRFERCSGDPEGITVKSSNNYIHHNYMVDCNSSLSLRHGNFNRVEDNVLVNTGFRMFGHNHSVRRNQFVESSHNQLRQLLVLLSGDQTDDNGSAGNLTAPHNSHASVYNCTVENNIVGSGSTATNALYPVYLGFDGSTVNPVYKPINNSLRNNIILGSTGTLTFQNTTGLGPTIYNVTMPGNTSAALVTATNPRYGILFLAASSLIGQTIKTWVVGLRKSGTPTGNVNARVYDGTTTVVATATETVDSSTIPTVNTTYSFNFPTARTIAANDRLVIEYNGASAVNISIHNTDQFDGGNTLRTRWNGTAWVNGATEDVAGTITAQGTAASWANNTVTGNIIWPTGTATAGSMPGDNINPFLSQNATDRTFSFTGNSPLTWTQSARALPVSEVGCIRGFM